MSGRGLEPVIGLEVHVQLATKTKLFCADIAEFGAPPNTHVCPVCLGLPGALPVTNAAAIELAVIAALGFGCNVHPTSAFARKNYFYPDLPKGYQITQFDRPLATGGSIDSPAGESTHPPVRLRRVHVEEDAGKSLHDRIDGCTAVDLNRAGTPLIEIVTEPDVVSPPHARACLTRLKQVLEYLEVSDCDMEKGSLRVDANVSLRRTGETSLGTKTELKNMNSFSSVERAIEFEIGRQRALLDAGGTIDSCTLLWDAASGEARVMRLKEESRDYRYFPEPDLPPLVIDRSRIELLRDGLPELPDARKRRLRNQFGLPEYDAGVLTASRVIADYFERVAQLSGDAKASSNRVMTDVLGWLNERRLTIDAFPVSADALAGLIRLTVDGTLSSSLARTVFARMIETGREAAEIVETEDLAQVSDRQAVEAWVDDVVARFPEEVKRLRDGETKVLAFLMGQVMKESAGRADPRSASELIRRKAEAGTA